MISNYYKSRFYFPIITHGAIKGTKVRPYQPPFNSVMGNALMAQWYCIRLERKKIAMKSESFGHPGSIPGEGVASQGCIISKKATLFKIA